MNGEPSVRGRATPIAGPALMAVVLVLIWASQNLGGFGPFDRATTGWVVLAFAFVSPYLAGVAGRRVVVGTAIGFGFVTAAWVLATFVPGARIGCRPTTEPLDFLGPALTLGAVGALAYLAAGLVAFVELRRGRRRALAASILVAILGGVGMLVTFLIVLGPSVACPEVR